ncbi:MAG: uroporphyrinogen decarboxylase family protein [Christensenellales bacterium]|jgi:hypothetical protein
MTSRERIACAFSHQEPDRVPMDFGGLSCGTMHATCISQLRDYYGLDKRPVKVLEPFIMIGEIEEDLKAVLGVDACAVMGPEDLFGNRREDWKEWQLPDGTEVLVPGTFTVTDDGKGGYYLHPKGDTSARPSGHMPQGGMYFDPISRQDEDLDIEDFEAKDNYADYQPWPQETLDHFEREALRCRETGRFVIIEPGFAMGEIAAITGPSQTNPKGLRSMEDWLMVTSMRPDFVKEIFEYQTDMAIENLKKLSKATVDAVDGVYICGTDMGMQHNIFYSLDILEDLFMPYYKKLNAWIHQNLGWKTIKHSCGANEPIIPLFIEAEFDCFNPVQCSAAGMDPQHLKDTYGKDIVFWGGGIDTQQVLPFGTPREVREQVLERLSIFSVGGGYVFNAIHNVQPLTPMENLIAMLDAFKEFNGEK